MDNSFRLRTRLLLVCLLIPCFAVTAQDIFSFRDGDRVVFLGNTLIEREGNFGYIETVLTRRLPEKSLTFRNLGYSAETVRGESRAMFDTQQEGFQRMVDQVMEASPTVLILCFGQNAAYAGENGLEDFLQGYSQLVKILDDSTDARIVVLSPPPLENLGPPLPDPADQNNRVGVYSKAIQHFAEEKGYNFIDLFLLLKESYQDPPEPHWTDNTIHFNPYGYWRLALILGEAFGISEKDWKIAIDLNEYRFDGFGTRLDSFHYNESKGLELLLTDTRLPLPNPPIEIDAEDRYLGHLSRTLIVSGMPEGRYELRVGESLFGIHTALEIAQGISIPLGPQESQVERLRRKVQEKSRLFFYRWRPQNWTYLYGFRKHEQGQNAKETPLFDPLIEEIEEEISQLKIPITYRLELVPTKGGTQ